ncbi:predicted protein [Nematostella vectensis]|uniref:Uncharacterized protein n=1 Tax=Nematostella vectensis TaxID=45351 RepID=A7RTL0_NEMVE|nr:predicted protein [Nematostella vectensis]|eukprot:XP_001637349.1 predicted protein [Nematostella vectensis]
MSFVKFLPSLSNLSALNPSAFVPKSSKVTLKQVLVLVLVFGIERIFEKDVFECPPSRYFMYGSLFLVGPAICLFSLTLLLFPTFWEVVTGCWGAHFSKRWVTKNLVKILFQALLPPGVWIVVALMRSNYYICLKLGPKKLALDRALRALNGSTVAQVKANVDETFSKAKADSEMLAWILFDSIVMLAFIVVCIRRCWCMRAEGSLPELDHYDKLEAEAAAGEFKILLEQRAEKAGKSNVHDEFENAKTLTSNEYRQLEMMREKLQWNYPRIAGDLSKPYRHQMLPQGIGEVSTKGHQTLNVNFL